MANRLIWAGYDGIQKPEPGWPIDWDHPQAAGLKLCHVFNDGAGAPIDLVSGRAATVVGTPPPIWTPGGRKGYSTTAYDAIDPPQQVYGVTYPCFMTVGYTSTSTSQSLIVGQTVSTNVAIAAIYLNFGAVAGNVSAYLKGDTGSTATPTATIPNLNDGLPHTIGVYSLSVSQHFVIFDGHIVGTSTTSISPTMGTPIYTLGVQRISAITNPFPGTLLWHIAGNGGVPDFAWQAREPFSFIAPPPTSHHVSFIAPPPSTSATTAGGAEKNRGIWAGIDDSTKPPAGWVIDADDDLAPALAGCYPLNEGAGVPASLVPLPTPILNGGVRWGQGKNGDALLFDGSSGYLDLVATAQLSPGPTGMTVAALIYPTSTASQTIFSRSRNSFGDSGFELTNSALTIQDGTFGLDTGSGTAAPANQWSVIVGRASLSANETSWWLNGVKGGTVGTCPSFVSFTGGETNLGASGNGASKAGFFGGLIESLWVFDSALTDAQIQRISRDDYPFFKPPVSHRTVSFASGGTVYFATISESSASADAMAASASFGAGLAETGMAGDSIAGAASFTLTLAESSFAVDSLAPSLAISTPLSESATSADSVAVVATFFAGIAESGTASDGMSAPQPGTGTITETVTASDSYAATASFAPTLAETGVAADGYAATATFSATVAESVTAFDSVTDATPGTLPPNLIAAIVTKFNATPALHSAMGDLCFGLDAPSASGAWPSARLDEIAETPKFTSANGYFAYVDLQFTVFTTDPDQCKSLAGSLAATFDDRSLNLLAFDDGYLMGFRRTGGNMRRNNKLQKNGVYVWQHVITYRATVGRQLP